MEKKLANNVVSGVPGPWDIPEYGTAMHKYMYGNEKESEAGKRVVDRLEKWLDGLEEGSQESLYGEVFYASALDLAVGLKTRIDERNRKITNLNNWRSKFEGWSKKVFIRGIPILAAYLTTKIVLKEETISFLGATVGAGLVELCIYKWGVDREEKIWREYEQRATEQYAMIERALRDSYEKYFNVTLPDEPTSAEKYREYIKNIDGH
jgi:hypothetical protein